MSQLIAIMLLFAAQKFIEGIIDELVEVPWSRRR
jgi:hypothetical protein